ncbi:unnamed protein product [Orchesella dallaii]|uniref:Uncharacterized protein n=1 Tax=Orchesella dallaii TaxID=48710 RepID=A0ABP1S3Q6_9HEXA
MLRLCRSDDESTAVAESLSSVLEINRKYHAESGNVEQENQLTAAQRLNRYQDNSRSKLSYSKSKMPKLFTAAFIIITVILGLIQLRVQMELRGLQGNLQDCGLRTQNFSKEIQNLYERLQSRNEEVDKLKDELSSKNSEIDQLNSQTEKFNSQTEEFNSQTEKFNSQTERFNLQTEKLNSQIDQLKSQISQLNAEITSSKNLQLNMSNAQFQNNYAQMQIFFGYVTSKVGFVPLRLLQKILQPQLGEHSVISIDLGSKYSHASIYFAGKVHKIPHYDQSGEVLDAFVSSVDLDNNFEGQSAQETMENSLNSSSSVFYDIVSFLRDDTFAEINGRILNSNVNYEFTPIQGTHGRLVSHNDIEYSVATILSKVFKKIREDSSKFLNFSIPKCIISHTFLHKTETLHKSIVSQAAQIAGFKEVSFLKPAIAAVTALVNPIDILNTTKNILYINLGARYWEFSVVKVDKGKYIELGGGMMYDTGYLQNDILNYSIQQYSSQFNISNALLKSTNQIRRLHDASEKAMIYLSTNENALIHVNEFYNGKNLTVNISREKFIELTARHFKAIGKYSREVLNSTGIYVQNIDKVVLVGGSSRIPIANKIVRKIFGEKVVSLAGLEPDEVVAFGAAVKGAILAAEMMSDDQSTVVAEALPSVKIIRKMSDDETTAVAESLSSKVQEINHAEVEQENQLPAPHPYKDNQKAALSSLITKIPDAQFQSTSVLQISHSNSAESEKNEPENLLTMPKEVNKHQDNPSPTRSFSTTKIPKLFTSVFIIITVILGIYQLRIEMKLMGLQEDLKHCNLQLGNRNEEIDKLNVTSSIKHSQIDQLKEKQISKDTQIHELNSQINQLKEMHISKDSQIDELNSQINQLKEMQISKNSQINLLNKEIKSKILELDDSNAERQTYYANMQICFGFVTSYIGALPSDFWRRVWQLQIGGSAISIDLWAKYTQAANYFAEKVHKVPHYDLTV